MGLVTGLDGRKISSPPGFDPRTVQPVPTELPGPHSSCGNCSKSSSQNSRYDSAFVKNFQNLFCYKGFFFSGCDSRTDAVSQNID